MMIAEITQIQNSIFGTPLFVTLKDRTSKYSLLELAKMIKGQGIKLIYNGRVIVIDPIYQEIKYA